MKHWEEVRHFKTAAPLVRHFKTSNHMKSQLDPLRRVPVLQKIYYGRKGFPTRWRHDAKCRGTSQYAKRICQSAVFHVVAWQTTWWAWQPMWRCRGLTKYVCKNGQCQNVLPLSASVGNQHDRVPRTTSRSPELLGPYTTIINLKGVLGNLPNYYRVVRSKINVLKPACNFHQKHPQEIRKPVAIPKQFPRESSEARPFSKHSV
jgi:hypothetical protein